MAQAMTKHLYSGLFGVKFNSLAYSAFSTGYFAPFQAKIPPE